MKTQHINPKEIFQSPFFTHTVGVAGPVKLVYVSGQVSYDRDGFVIGKDDMRAQAEQVFKCLTHNLRAAGATWSDVVKMNSYMVRMSAEALNLYREVRSRYLDPKRMPASTLVGVKRLVHEDLLLEVEVVAAVAAREAPKKAKKKKR
ncbi:MAG TPA: RidA family protein [Burkholderiales bacterium]|nr:RidA family protein [Burkholderiales bacterium]